MRDVVPRRAAGTIAIAVALAATAGGAASQELAPHRAVYDLTLVRAGASVSMLSAQGRLVFEVNGAVCEGFTNNSRFVTRTVNREGDTVVDDLRLSTFETFEPAEFVFLNQTVSESDTVSVVEGRATGKASGTIVELTEPKERTARLPRAVFPTQHTVLILQAAAAGERVLEAPVFDGGGDADRVFATTTVIGDPETGLQGAGPRERSALAAVPDAAELATYTLVISYFDQGATSGEAVPDYVISFRMLQNGISYDATFDYGSFALAGRLVELELGPATQCPEDPQPPEPQDR
ncbi:EipB family protein [Acuticoccus sp.]|uniref:EipB family protein n=1 Tax=Acuticoccus sp. TaxID=1904378 RepID=UPI003B51AEAC